jgi:hypothetical protein
MALRTGSKPMFYGNTFSEPLLPYPDHKLWIIGKNTVMSNSVNFLDKIDEDLCAAWVAMQRFCSLVNLAIETQRVFSLEIVLDTMAAVMYRLLNMGFETDSVEEAIRLGLLSLSYRIFLQWQDMGFPSFYFPSIYRSSLSNLKLVDGFPPQIMLWLLMIGGISGFTTPDNMWLKDCLQKHTSICHVKSWDELRDILKSFMWTTPLHDKLGKDIFDSILRL